MTFVRNHIKEIVAAFIALALSLFGRIAFGQETEVTVETISPFAETVWVVYMLTGTAIVGFIGWGLLKLQELASKSKVMKNEYIAGLVSRLRTSVHDAVTMVDQTLKSKVKAARDPSSEGGMKITQKEAGEFDDAVWMALKNQYGGWDGIAKTFGDIVIGDTPEAVKKALVDTVGVMKESAVHTNKMRRKAAEAPSVSP